MEFLKGVGVGTVDHMFEAGWDTPVGGHAFWDPTLPTPRELSGGCDYVTPPFLPKITSNEGELGKALSAGLGLILNLRNPGGEVQELEKTVVTGARAVAGENALFRGGSSLKARLGVDVKAGSDGLISKLGRNGKPQGLSLNSDPKNPLIQKYGGAFPVESLPEDLEVVQSGNAGHYVIAPKGSMSFEKYQQLLNQIKLGNFNSLP